MKRILHLTILCLLLSSGISAQVTIGSGQKPNAGALLDLKEDNELGANSKKGLLLPRVALEKLNSIEPIPVESQLPADLKKYIGLTVYNTTSDFSQNICPGIYIWSSDQWMRLNSNQCERQIPAQLLNSPNCYMTIPSGVVEDIPIAKAFLVWEKYQWGKIGQDVKISADLLWQDTPGLVEKVEIADPSAQDVEKKIRVTLKSNGVAGNASVVVRMGANGDTTDPIYWSWHIWVAKHDPSTQFVKHNNGEKDYTFMTRNLGATHPDDNATQTVAWMGLHYQWGRKDPFTASYTFKEPGERKLYDINDVELTEVDELKPAPPGTGFKHVETVESNNLKNSVLNPSTFYYGPYISYPPPAFDWNTADGTGASSNDNLWNDIAGKKTEFDPCPAGWRVPARSATKSPWGQEFDPEHEWDTDNEFIEMHANGLYLKTTPGNTTPLGLYPFSYSRLGRAFKGDGFVGSPTTYIAGGLFEIYFNYDIGKGFYWTGSAVAGSAKAYINQITPENTMMGVSAFFESGEESRAVSGFVRCVKED